MTKNKNKKKSVLITPSVINLCGTLQQICISSPALNAPRMLCFDFANGAKSTTLVMPVDSTVSRQIIAALLVSDSLSARFDIRGTSRRVRIYQDGNELLPIRYPTCEMLDSWAATINGWLVPDWV